MVTYSWALTLLGVIMATVIAGGCASAGLNDPNGAQPQPANTGEVAPTAPPQIQQIFDGDSYPFPILTWDQPPHETTDEQIVAIAVALFWSAQPTAPDVRSMWENRVYEAEPGSHATFFATLDEVDATLGEGTLAGFQAVGPGVAYGSMEWQAEDRSVARVDITMVPNEEITIEPGAAHYNISVYYRGDGTWMITGPSEGDWRNNRVAS